MTSSLRYVFAIMTVIAASSSRLFASPVGATRRGVGSSADPVAWESAAERVCAKSSRTLDALLEDFPDVLASGEKVVLSKLSPSERKEAAAFFKSLSAAKARFARQLDRIAPDPSSVDAYDAFVGAMNAEAIAYRRTARKILALETGKSDKGSIAKELDVAATAEQVAALAVSDLGITCDAVHAGEEPGAAAEAPTCYSGATPADMIEVPCTQTHDAELFITIDGVFPDDVPYPDVDEALAIADQRCQPEFEKFVGISLDQSAAYGLSYALPSEEQWAQGGRSVDCYIVGYPEGTPLTGSAAGTKR